MSGKMAIKRRLDDIEAELRVGDSMVEVRVVFDESMRIEGMEELPTFSIPREKAEAWMRRRPR